MSENRVVKKSSAFSSGCALALCITYFSKQANVTLVDGHEDDALLLMHRVKGTIKEHGRGRVES